MGALRRRWLVCPLAPAFDAALKQPVCRSPDFLADAQTRAAYPLARQPLGARVQKMHRLPRATTLLLGRNSRRTPREA